MNQPQQFFMASGLRETGGAYKIALGYLYCMEYMNGPRAVRVGSQAQHKEVKTQQSQFPKEVPARLATLLKQQDKPEIPCIQQLPQLFKIP